MTEMYRTIEVVAGLVTDEHGRVLATRCPLHKHDGGWEFPGGKIEPGEEAVAAVVREIAEELSLVVEPLELLHVVEWDYPTFRLRMQCFICRVKSGELCLHEHIAARWLSAEELGDVTWLPADVEVLESLAAYLRG